MSVDAAIACNRFGLGAKPGEISAARRNPQGWLQRQISKTPTDFPRSGLRSSQDLLSELFSVRDETKRLKKAGTTVDLRKRERAFFRDVLNKELLARQTYAAKTNNSFHERLVRFWSNHFSVSRRSSLLNTIIGVYEREAIRPNILGSFEQLAISAIYHPAMLYYLNNNLSIGPSTRFGRNRNRGLNENLAREILELHTVTPEANYSQTDVTEFSKALTGWTIGNARWGPDAVGQTSFFEALHEPGTRTVLGRRYAGQNSTKADRIISDLCHSPHTAQNISYKLAKHFVADIPPARLVDRLRTTFLQSRGDLSAVYYELLASPEAWTPSAEKVKTPADLLTSSSRMLGLKPVFAGSPTKVFNSFGQKPFDAPSPKGWADDAKTWLGPDSLSKRIEWANRTARRASNVDARWMLQQSVGDRLSRRTLNAVSRAASGQQALALALLSPDFQRR